MSKVKLIAYFVVLFIFFLKRDGRERRSIGTGRERENFK